MGCPGLADHPLEPLQNVTVKATSVGDGIVAPKVLGRSTAESEGGEVAGV